VTERDARYTARRITLPSFDSSFARDGFDDSRPGLVRDGASREDMTGRDMRFGVDLMNAGVRSVEVDVLVTFDRARVFGVADLGHLCVCKESEDGLAGDGVMLLAGHDILQAWATLREAAGSLSGLLGFGNTRAASRALQDAA
jgi:hypothetical protein